MFLSLIRQITFYKECATELFENYHLKLDYPVLYKKYCISFLIHWFFLKFWLFLFTYFYPKGMVLWLWRAKPSCCCADTDVCPRQMAVIDVPYCASIGFVFKPLHMPRSWRKKIINNVRIYISRYLNFRLIDVPCLETQWYMNWGPLLFLRS